MGVKLIAKKKNKSEFRGKTMKEMLRDVTRTVKAKQKKK
jgi:hypothetical protein